MGLFGSNDSGRDEVDIACDPQGDYVTPARVGKVDDVLDDGENVHYLTRGSTVDVQEGGDNSSLFGDDRSRKSGTRGWVRAAFTDSRVVVKVPQILGNDERSIPYQNIASVDLDTGLITKRVTLQTMGATYHIEVDDPGKDEVRDATRFVRQKLSEPNGGGGTEDSELDKLEQLKKLHDEGALSDEEFKKQKQKILDRM
jgi:hypothetical protein